MTHAEMPPRGPLDRIWVVRQSNGQLKAHKIQIEGAHSYIQESESQARESRAREEGRAEAFDEAFTMLRNDPRHPLTLESRLRDAAKAARAAASRSGEGE